MLSEIAREPQKEINWSLVLIPLTFALKQKEDMWIKIFVWSVF